MDRAIDLAILLASCLVLLPAAGCGPGGPELGTVSGTVTLDGKPLPNARLEFQPLAKGSPSYGTTDENGRYELVYGIDRPGAMVGKHEVRISTAREYREDDEGPLIVVEEFLPPKYNEQTELTREVKSGSQEINFPLKSR